MRAAIATAIAAVVLVPSAVYASHTFTDVPDSNPFHNQITWLASTGITSGCGGTNYCPGNAVTRGQMAVFLRGSFNLDNGLTAVDHADDGGSTPSNTIDAASITTLPGLSAAVTIPPGTKGRVVATISGDAFCNFGDNTFIFVAVIFPQCQVRLLINGAEMSPGWQTAMDSDDGAADPDVGLDSHGFSLQSVSAVNLNPGTYTITAQIMANDQNDNADDELVFDIGNVVLRADAVLNDAA
jgi:hypothetical protein